MDLSAVTLDTATYLAGAVTVVSAYASIWGAKRVISLFRS